MIVLRTRFVALLLVVPFVASCASETLRGVPQGLGKDEAKAILRATSVKQSLDAANDLAFIYADARNECINYRFWSSASYIPLAAIASWAIYAKASGDVLAGTGLVAGGVAGTSVLINPANNGSVYQHGIDAIHCVQLALLPYADADSMATRIDDERATLEATSLVATNLADTIDAFPTSNAKEVRTLKSDTLASLLKARKKLGDAINAADAGIAAADSEIKALHEATHFAGNLVFTLDGTVASKISQGSVDYAGLITSISGSMTTGKKEKTKMALALDRTSISAETKAVDERLARTMPKATAAELAAIADTMTDELAARTKVLSALVDESAFPKAKAAAVQCLGKI